MVPNGFLYTRWLHKKSQHQYFIIGECRLEATNKRAFLYVPVDDRNGTPWARDIDEFLDGRFVRVDPEE